MSYSKIIGTGSYLPEKVVTNHDIAKTLDTSDEWIVQRTGIHRRHVVSDNETTSLLGYHAATRALEDANISANDLDLIIVATCTPEYFFPSTACIIQKKLGINTNIPSFDILAACSGFIYALSIADQYIKNGKFKNALVIGAETLTRAVDWTDRRTCILFGDGAGAVVLQKSDQAGILSTHIHSSGKYSDLLYLKNETISHPEGPHQPYIQMMGNEVFKIAVNKLEESVKEAMEYNNIGQADVDWFIPHQANFRIIKTLTKRLSIPMSKVILSIDDHANTAAASIPLALDYGIKQGKIKRGQKLLLEALGGGVIWGSALLQY